MWWVVFFVVASIPMLLLNIFGFILCFILLAIFVFGYKCKEWIDGDTND